MPPIVAIQVCDVLSLRFTEANISRGALASMLYRNQPKPGIVIRVHPGNLSRIID